ncbi:LysR family transcriptional regulator [Bradyrhizobium sp. WSM 1704]|uniref:LysR family transcriptional regulator n=1 Tax=Bradyrhizobium semiaridum TaxID=2821404 RepID=UPI001CE2ED11|nr:LysR family transcriptional regulator [Bradyrhizobium semiaridum]MCA6121272.1 LysR family transcriptional regulator [Bradyrhizobium semiaridum]
MMNLMHWRTVVAVADYGNITRAAERVGLTQSGASQAIALLEELLGVQLFTRDRRQTVPTAVGFQIIEQARVMLSALETIRTVVDESRGLERGTIRMACFPVVLATILPPILRRFKQSHPGIDVITLEASDEEIDALIAAGQVDIGMVVNPPASRNSVLLGRDPWVAVVPNGHRFARPARRDVVALSELVAEPFILATGGCRATAEKVIAEQRLKLDDLRVSVRDWSSAFALVREGVGVTLVPELTLPDNRQGLRILELAEPVHRRFGLVSHTKANTKAVRAFFDMLQPA